jgi:ribosomal protein L16/L10AE
MGKGKGKFVEFSAYTRRGQIIFEFSRLSQALLQALFALIEKKIGLKLKKILRF